MTMIGAAVADFGSGLGLTIAGFDEGSHFALAIDDIGQVHFEHQPERLLVYVSRPINVALDRFVVAKAALRAVHFDHRLAVRAQCALHGDDLVFIAQFEKVEVDQPTLELALQTLGALHDKVRL